MLSVETAAELHAIVGNRTGSESEVSLWVPSGTTLALGGPIVVSGFNLTISSNADDAIIDGVGRSLVFNVSANAKLRLHAITIRGGAGGHAGGIESAGVVELSIVIVSDCWSDGAAGGMYVYGGSVALSGSTIANCSVSASEVRLRGGVMLRARGRARAVGWVGVAARQWGVRRDGQGGACVAGGE